MSDDSDHEKSIPHQENQEEKECLNVVDEVVNYDEDDGGGGGDDMPADEINWSFGFGGAAEEELLDAMQVSINDNN